MAKKIGKPRLPFNFLMRHFTLDDPYLEMPLAVCAIPEYLLSGTS